MAYPDGFLDELAARTDMVELVRQYVPLQRRGTRWVGRCPFHSEKTPSFNVTPEKGAFHCFGCKAGGYATQFVMQIENLEFQDAVKFLADRAGMAVPESDDPGARARRERLLAANRFAARWFYDNLSRPEGAAVVEYMRRRNIKPAMAKRFGLGAAPAGWDGLLNAATNEGFTLDELQAAGLVKRGQKGNYYDFFRERLMFPLFDIRGTLIAFTGRALHKPAEQGELKFWNKFQNSPETSVYRKRYVLYGAHFARKTKRPYWILCEGNPDVVMLHQAGFDCAVAPCGTSLTDEQARLIARTLGENGEALLCYDTDDSGQEAAKKAIAILEKAGMKVRVLRMPDDVKDPDEFIQKYGPDAFEKLIAGSSGSVEYRLGEMERHHDLQSDAGKVEYLRQTAFFLAGLPGQAERQVYAARVAARLGIESKAVMRDVEAAARQRKKKDDRAYSTAVMRGKGVMAAGAPMSARAEEIALFILLNRPDLLEGSGLQPDDFAGEGFGRMFAALQNGENPETDMALAGIAAKMRVDPPIPDMTGAEQSLSDCAARIKARSAKAGDQDQDTRVLQKMKNRYGG